MARRQVGKHGTGPLDEVLKDAIFTAVAIHRQILLRQRAFIAVKNTDAAAVEKRLLRILRWLRVFLFLLGTVAARRCVLTYFP